MTTAIQTNPTASVIDALEIIHRLTGWQALPVDLPRFTILLRGYDAETIQFAALEWLRQRPKDPPNPQGIAQFCGFLARAIRAAEDKYTYSEKAADRSDTFLPRFVAALGADTQGFIQTRATQINIAPAVIDDDPQTEIAQLRQFLATTNAQIAQLGATEYLTQYRDWLLTQIAALGGL